LDLSAARGKPGKASSAARLQSPGSAQQKLDASAGKLTLKERFIYAQALVDTRTENQLQAFLDWASAHGHVDAVLALRSQLNDGIERHLKGKRPLAQMRNRQRRGGPRVR
jgi:ATP-dependent RNA helicase SUPV3L1/SUV3